MHFTIMAWCIVSFQEVNTYPNEIFKIQLTINYQMDDDFLLTVTNVDNQWFGGFRLGLHVDI